MFVLYTYAQGIASGGSWFNTGHDRQLACLVRLGTAPDAARPGIHAEIAIHEFTIRLGNLMLQQAASYKKDFFEDLVRLFA